MVLKFWSVVGGGIAICSFDNWSGEMVNWSIEMVEINWSGGPIVR
jgi:hypothetical protein